MVAEVDDGERAWVVGFSSFGPYRLEAGDDKTMETKRFAEQGTVGEIYGFYVHPDHWGSGVANELMDGSISALVNDGWPMARLWVLADNARARRFYERRGWRADGERQELSVGGHPFEVRMARSMV